MNERITQLAMEAAQYSLLPAAKYDKTFIEKFAELIVKECRAAINTEDTFLIAGPCDRLICEHFGIEELSPLIQ